MEVDREAVESRLSLFRGYVEELESLRARRDEFQRSLLLRMAVERLLQLAIECLLDVAQHVAAAKGRRPPESYADSITVLEESGLIDERRADLYRSIARFRNVLVHGYVRLDPSEVYRVWVEGLNDLREMARDLLRASLDP
ncbi:MAG: DUF86 domain-containing protein [Candidatus Korarchaeota archaeon]|nr:DUF86 domain-containing protein [Candidatus Korarchaeota archaeon]